ncbi:uncharacterized protein LOC134271904 [Saccostrea cucullata]|uniref:uncharacterized protein LOC134271904 n=1 Tax=Saccostrea cuccullata TaxID=36930 RepID=UPI002ED4E66A
METTDTALNVQEGHLRALLKEAIGVTCPSQRCFLWAQSSFRSVELTKLEFNEKLKEAKLVLVVNKWNEKAHGVFHQTKDKTWCQKVKNILDINMDKLHPPKGLSLTGNVADNWIKFKQRFELYIQATGLEADKEKPTQKACLFLHLIGEDALEVYNNFQFAQNEDEKKLDKIIEKFEAYCMPKKNTTYERHKFFTLMQKPDETMDQYVTELRTKAKNCELGDLTDSLIRDRIICGVPDDSQRERLLRVQDLTLDGAIRMCRTTEATKERMKELKPEDKEVHAVKSKHNPKPFKQKQINKAFLNKGYQKKNHEQCKRCGGNHGKDCPAVGQVCKKCGKQNHYAKMCFTSKKKVHEINEFNDSESEAGEFFVYTVENTKAEETDEWFTHLKTNGTEIKYKLDTGSQEHVCVMRKQQVYKLHFVIVTESRTPIIGVSACSRLGLVQRVYMGLGCLPGEHKIQLDKNVPPVIHPCRKVPFTLHDKLKQELDRMEKANVICKVEVSSIVLPVKKNGALTVCLDPRDLNKAIKREHFKLPSREEVMSKFKDAKYFSKPDASSGFWQMKLDKQSSMYTCFNTPFGRYRFLRLPFGISSAPEVYHKAVHMILEHLKGTSSFMDDIIVWGANLEEHNERIKQVLETVRGANLKLNKSKCEFGVQELTFLGDVISDKGIKPDPEKIWAIEQFPTPTNKQDVQRFLGMVNYQGKYIPDLSTKTHTLRRLLEEKNVFQWTQEEKESFEELKKVLTSAPVLQFYDPNAETRISSDASKTGLGAVLLQKHDDKWMPVAYASRAMTTAEKNYAQIEKEMLAITFACERFHQFIYGQAVQVETDHKPLETIFKKSLSDCPIRIQRLMLRLQKYTLVVFYTPGKFMHTADALSRAYLQTACSGDLSGEEEVQVYVDSVITNLSVSDRKLKEIRQETVKDEQLQKLEQTIRDGFPKQKWDLPSSIQEYWNFRSELSYADGLILKGTKIVIPNSLRKEMLQKIHTGHLGIEKCRQRARQIMYWPGMNQSIEEKVKSCSECLKHRAKQTAEPLLSHETANYPWAKIGVDLCVCNNKNYLVMCEYYSNYPEVCPLKKTTSTAFNGLAEKTVGIIKNLLKKSEEDFYLSLLAYRATPLSCGKSPAEILYNRKLRTDLPMLEEHLYTSNREDVIKQRKASQGRQKYYYDRSTHQLPKLEEGDVVRLRNLDDTAWTERGTIQKQIDPRSYIVSTGNAEYRRNRKDILRTCENPTSYLRIEPEPSDHEVEATGDENIRTRDDQNGETVRPKRQCGPPKRLTEEC